MIILFEGPDLCGKTNIAKALSKELNIPYFKKPNEHGAFNGTYIPEYSLIYETRKFLEFYEQDIIKNVILDRDYVSEYVYGQIYRNEIYNQLNINEYIREYDKRYFMNDLFIVYCHKDKYKKFDDEVIEEKDIQKIKDGYGKFLNATFNNCIVLETSDENLEEQIKIIKNHIDKIQAINNFNDRMYSKYSLVDSQIYFPGSFRSDEILFIGQNPGQPDPSDERSVKLHREKFSNYREFLLEHEISYKKCKFYKFISEFSKQHVTYNCQFSFTNLVKFSTFNNAPPSANDILNNSRILTAQLEKFKPKKIISFGSQAHNALTELNIEHEAFHHPSKYNYSKTERF